MRIMKLKLQIEVIQISIYSNLILQILNNHKELSLTKIIVFSYLMKQDKFKTNSIYNGKTSKDIIYKALSQMNGNFDNFCNSISYIIKAIHLLVSKKIIVMEDEILMLNEFNDESNSKTETIYVETKFMKNAINESRYMSDVQFIKEVINNV